MRRVGQCMNLGNGPSNNRNRTNDGPWNETRLKNGNLCWSGTRIRGRCGEKVGAPGRQFRNLDSFGPRCHLGILESHLVPPTVLTRWVLRTLLLSGISEESNRLNTSSSLPLYSKTEYTKLPPTCLVVLKERSLSSLALLRDLVGVSLRPSSVRALLSLVWTSRPRMDLSTATPRSRPTRSRPTLPRKPAGRRL
jgi:hypothetical protein